MAEQLAQDGTQIETYWSEEYDIPEEIKEVALIEYDLKVNN